MAKRITEKQIDALIERLTKKVEEANTLFLEKIGASINKVGKLSPTKAHQLVQILKYGGNYDDIIKEIKRITGKGIRELDTIFDEYAKQDQAFYKGFYEYKNIGFTEYANNMALKNQTTALRNMVKNELYNYTRDNVLGYSFKDLKGNVIFKGIRETYNDLLDRALMNVGQGKETFDNAMRDILRDIGGSGLKTIDYDSGRSVRLDSVVKMHLKSRLRELHNENQKIIAQEIGADGIEISVHENPAPDHEDAQGRQFTIREFDKLQSIGIATDTKGKIIDMHRNDETIDFRPISEMNCYHYIFTIVLGVNEPEYSDEQLEDIKKRNQEGFYYKGKHYTNYQGTQMQRKLETAIREQKDIAILGKASGDSKLVLEANNRIKTLKSRYNTINELSGLKGKPKHMRVATNRISAEIPKEPVIETPKVELKSSKYEKTSKIFNHSKQWLDLENEDNIKIYNATDKLNIKIYERKNLKKAYYSSYERAIHTTGVNTDNLQDKSATTTLWHELGHSLDNNNFKEYLSNNETMRDAMRDFYKANPDVPQKVKDYFTDLKTKVNSDLSKEYTELYSEKEYINKKVEEWKNDKFYANNTIESLQENAKKWYGYAKDRYVREHRYNNMEYAQRGNLSDMFSAMSKGKYQWCKSYGYHTAQYYNEMPYHPATELFANFTSLKMTGQKKQLELFKEVAPDVYRELEKVYKKIGDELNVK